MYCLLFLTILETTVLVQSKHLFCAGNTFYKRNNTQKCHTCKPCALGYEYNISFVRQTSENGFLDCPPCVPCPDNYYRKCLTQPACYICSLDCQALNRYSSQRCGASSQGHCGECIIGYVSFSKEPNDICLRGNTFWRVSLSPSAEFENRSPELFSDSQNVTQSSFEPGKGKDLEISTLPLIVATPLLIAVLITVVIVCVCLERRKKVSIKEMCCSKTATQTPPNSNHDLISNTKSTILEVEHDGPELVALVKPETCNTVRACHNRSAEINVRIPSAHDQFLKEDEKQRFSMKSVRLTKDDKYITYVAGNVSGERRYELFRYLKIDEAKSQPEEELWEKKKQSFGDYIHSVLKIWITIADKNATLGVLCSSLQQAGFQHIVNGLLKLSEEPESEH